MSQKLTVELLDKEEASIIVCALSIYRKQIIKAAGWEPNSNKMNVEKTLDKVETLRNRFKEHMVYPDKFAQGVHHDFGSGTLLGSNNTRAS